MPLLEKQFADWKAPRGAHPSYAHGYYARDNAFYVEWDRIARDRTTFQAWLRDHVMGPRP